VPEVDGLTRTAVVLVTHNSADVLEACLDSIRECAGGVHLTDVVVVDNASTDASTEVAEAVQGLPLSVVHMGANAGYAAGFNAGVERLRATPPEAVLLLNPDCRLHPGVLDSLTNALHGPHRGISAPRLVNPDGSLQPSLRRAPSVPGAVAEAVVGGRLADRLGLGELIFDPAAHDHPGPATWVTGAALLMSWDMLEEVGPWDEGFLLYSEETEFMLRAADHGWTTWYEPSAVIEHRGGESDVRPDLASLLLVNKVALFRRRHGVVRAFVYRTALLGGLLVRAVAGGPTARAAAAALVLPSRRITSLSQLPGARCAGGLR
jgi:GT2 family glycosyltransferase